MKEIRNSCYEDDERRYQKIRRLIENKKILDFGCGAGGFLKRAKEIAQRADGVELERSMREIMQKENIQCYDSIDSALNLSGGEYDVITMFHVLEHLPDPIKMLSDIKQLLATDGRIIIEVPNANDALLSLYNSKPFADFTYWICHLYLFSNETLEKVAKRAGLKISFLQQIQRYPLSNHLYWLSNSRPGGHNKWTALNDVRLDTFYGDILSKLGIADTIFAELVIENI